MTDHNEELTPEMVALMAKLKKDADNALRSPTLMRSTIDHLTRGMADVNQLLSHMCDIAARPSTGAAVLQVMASPELARQLRMAKDKYELLLHLRLLHVLLTPEEWEQLEGGNDESR